MTSARFSRIGVILATAAAAAAAQSCADGVADVAEGPTAPMAAGAATSAAVCPVGATSIPVGAETHCQLAGVIDADIHLTAGPTYQIFGRVQIGRPAGLDGAGEARTLRIDPGVRLYGADRGASLEIARGSRLIAAGTEASPILFTSAWDVGAAAALGLPERSHPAAPRGEWGGLIVSGASDVAGADGVDGAACAAVADGGVACERPGEIAGSGPFGGAAGQAASSGALRHVEIRYAGAIAEGPGGLRRTPALTLQGVGAGTEIAGVTIVNAFGDGLRLLGGWVDVADVTILGAGDDGVEWGLGYRGTLRNVVAAHEPRLGDGDAGFEGAGGAAAAAGEGLAHAIRSRPTLIDVVAIGDAAVSDAGLVLRDGTGVSIRSAAISGRFARAGFDVDGAETYRRLRRADLAGLTVNTEGSPGLSTDFDDRRLAAAARDARLEPMTLTLAEALAQASARRGLTAENPENVGSARAPTPAPAGPQARETQAAQLTPLPPLEPVASVAPLHLDGRFHLTEAAYHPSTDL